MTNQTQHNKNSLTDLFAMNNSDTTLPSPGFTGWMSMFFSMLFNPEDFHLQRAIHGLGKTEWKTDADRAMEQRLQAAEDAKAIADKLPDGPEKTAKIRELTNSFLSGVPIGDQTLLHPGLMDAITITADEQIELDLMSPENRDKALAALDEKMYILEDIIAQTNTYNIKAIQDGRPEVDPYMVANWMWEKTNFNPKYNQVGKGAGLASMPKELIQQYGYTAEDLTANPETAVNLAVQYIGDFKAQTGNAYLAIMHLENEGYKTKDGKTLYIGKDPQSYTAVLNEIKAKIAEDKGIQPKDVDLSKHLPDNLSDASKILGIDTELHNETITELNSAYWDTSQRDEVKALMNKARYTVPDADATANTTNAEFTIPATPPG